jgi:hypothetical protein
MKYLGITLTKDVNDLYKENCKSLQKEIKDYRMWNYLLCSWIGRISKNGYATNFHQNQNSSEIEKSTLKFI